MRQMLLSLVLCVGVACQPCEVERASTAGPDVEAIRAWLDRYVAAVNAGDLNAWASFIADDAVVMPPDELPISGIDTLRPLYDTVFRTYSFDFSPRVDEVVVAGELAILRAVFEETVTPTGEGEPIELSGSWIVILRRQADGSWKLWRNMWGAIPASVPDAAG